MSDEGAQVDDALRIVLLGRAVPDNALKVKFSVTAANGKTYQVNKYTEAATEWMKYVKATAEDALRSLPAGSTPAQWPLPLVLDVLFVKQLCDLTNAFKGMNDALAQALQVDDSYFEYGSVRRLRERGKTPKGAARIEITIRPAPPEEAMRPQPKNRKPRKTREWIGSVADRPTELQTSTRRRRQRDETPLQRAVRAALAAENTKPAALPTRRAT